MSQPPQTVTHAYPRHMQKVHVQGTHRLQPGTCPPAWPPVIPPGRASHVTTCIERHTHTYGSPLPENPQRHIQDAWAGCTPSSARNLSPGLATRDPSRELGSVGLSRLDPPGLRGCCAPIESPAGCRESREAWGEKSQGEVIPTRSAGTRL